MATRTTNEETQPVATVEPGSICPCCNRRVPQPKATTEEAKAKERERRRLYNLRDDVKERRAEYRKQRRERIQAAMELLAAQERQPDDLLDPPTEQGVI